VGTKVLISSSWDPVIERVGMVQSCIHQGKFRLDIRKHFFTKDVVKPCNRLTREAIDAPSLSVFKTSLDNALNMF